MQTHWMKAYIRPLAAVVGVAGTLAFGPAALAQPYGPPRPPPGAYRPPPPPARGYYWHGRYWHNRAWAYDRHHHGYWRYY